MIQIIFLSIVLLTQSTFDSARIHNHTASLTYEGVWVKRMHVDTTGQWPLGNQLAVRGATNELWFYYGFDPIKDGPLISTAEGTKTGRKVRVTYDPACFYVTKIEDLGAMPAPSPTPTPSPSPTPLPSPTPPPTPLTADFAWPSKLADQRILREEVRRNNYTNCQIYNSRYWCERP